MSEQTISTPTAQDENVHHSRMPMVAIWLSVVALVLVLSACGPVGDDRPEPNALVEQYLTAIAEGDAAAASELDAAAIEEAHGGDESIDVQSLRVDEVLEFAENRIDDIAVNERSHPGDHGPDTRRVSFAFTIADDEYDSSLEVRWEEDSDEWRLTESLTVNFSTEAVRNQASYESAPFQIAGISRTLSEDAATAPLRYLVYPGVYRVTSAIPADLLTRDAEPVQDVVATTKADTGAQFDVVRLPSDAE
ncbi:MAG: hypothetical protein ACTH8F_13320 [Microbacterium sp.]|uniref:hypothetical protein n=1 Tax=Microbacterium sp. TaxID=51671 RepID=UPI003F9DD0FF